MPLFLASIVIYSPHKNWGIKKISLYHCSAKISSVDPSFTQIKTRRFSVECVTLQKLFLHFMCERNFCDILNPHHQLPCSFSSRHFILLVVWFSEQRKYKTLFYLFFLQIFCQVAPSVLLVACSSWKRQETNSFLGSMLILAQWN